jgi:putative DNA primase/helicase
MNVEGFISIAEALQQRPRSGDSLLDVPELDAPDLEVTSLDEFLTLKLEPRTCILSPILPERGLAMVFAPRGVGKTHVALGVSYAVSTGSSFLRWTAPMARRVLYVDGEMPQETLQDWCRTMTAGLPLPEPEYFRLLAMDQQALGVNLNLALPKHQRALESRLGAADFLVLDNISTLVNGGRENDADSWDSMQSWLLGLRRRGMTVLLVAHAGRNDNPRGTSKREDVLDTVIKLMRPDDYEPNQGARFEVHLTKARGMIGDDAAPFEARLSVENG